MFPPLSAGLAFVARQRTSSFVISRQAHVVFSDGNRGLCRDGKLRNGGHIHVGLRLTPRAEYGSWEDHAGVILRCGSPGLPTYAKRIVDLRGHMLANEPGDVFSLKSCTLVLG